MESIGQALSEKDNVWFDVSLALFTDGCLCLFRDAVDNVVNVSASVTLNATGGTEMAVAFDNLFGWQFGQDFQPTKERLL